MDKLIGYYDERPRERPHKNFAFKGLLTVALLATTSLTYLSKFTNYGHQAPAQRVPINAQQILDKCSALSITPGPPSDFHKRTVSDRFEDGTPPVLIRNATLWTGNRDGKEVIKGDMLLDKGIVQAVGDVDERDLAAYKDLVTVDAKGAWVTPGIVDVHSHIGVSSAPELDGASDMDSRSGLILPWLRSVDALNTHDAAYRLSISGGVTTANILPGSSSAIGGQGFTIKLRPTKERSTTSRLLEPPFSINSSAGIGAEQPRWRQMKHACGEVPSRVHGTRMDTQWAFRDAYETARKHKVAQDEYCAKAVAGQWTDLGPFPENFQWEALVDVLRGKVKIHNHCYEAVDIDNMVRLTNEFKFSIASFHHAHEAYLIPDLLKKAYGETPSIALFASVARFNREAYRGSPHAARILTDNGLRVVMKSDHPILDSHFLVNEARQAHYYGLAENLALASVISNPAVVLGYDHRIGFLKKGYDADIVIWDSHPLQIGATPKQVYIDGIQQIASPHASSKPSALQTAPKTPDFDREIKATIKFEGLPPLAPKKAKADLVVFTNVSSLHVRAGAAVQEIFDVSLEGQEPTFVAVRDGKVMCTGFDNNTECRNGFKGFETLRIDLEGGSISPALLSYGSLLGLNHIDQESSTNDGSIVDQIQSSNSALLGPGPLIRAVDGLLFDTRDALLGYRAGATVGVTAPSGGLFLKGLATAFDTGAPHKLSPHAVLQNITALHVAVQSTTPSISTQIAALRNLLSGGGTGEIAKYFALVAEGEIPLVIDVQSADVIASLIELKLELDSRLIGKKTKFTITGANEAHILAKEIGEAGIGVILTQPRPYPSTWKGRRILPGPPLTAETSASILHKNNVTVGLGILQKWEASSIRFDIGWTALDSSGRISKTEAIRLATGNLEELLGVKTPNLDLVAVKRGSLHDLEGQVVAVVSSRQKVVNLIE